MATPPLLMIPGPTTVRPEVLAALAEPVRSHTSPQNAETMRRVEDGVRACFGTAAGRVHVFAGAGTLAMEAAVVNHAAPGDRMVVASQGYFGERFAEIGEAVGLDVVRVETEWGRRLDPEQLRRACADRTPAIVTITHVDTSTGVLADVTELARVARESGALVVLDGVCATGGIEERMDEWGVDVCLTGAQKALSVPPGLAILALSERARERRRQLGRIAAYYADLQRWPDESGRYFSTHATGMLRALEASLDAIERETLAARFARHQRLARALRDGFAALDVTPLTAEEALAPTLSVLRIPDPQGVRTAMADRGVIVAPCLGPFADKGIRIGHMGEVTPQDVERTLTAAAEALGRPATSALDAASLQTHP